MQTAMAALTVLAGLVFSFAVGLLVEEFLFGQIFRVFLVARIGRKRDVQ
jgi:hypothetical protein